MAYSTIFYDLDNTLYPADSGVWEAIAERIHLYLRERMHFPIDEIPTLRKRLYNTYGTTMRGLQVLYNVDPREYLDFVHAIPLRQLVQPNPALRPVLLRYPQRRIILTNADSQHARRVLEILEIGDCFESIIDILDMAPYCKPHPEAFDSALRLAGNPNPQECLLVDDTLPNLASARDLGFYTVRVGSMPDDSPCHSAIATLTDLPAALDAVLLS